MGASVFPSRTLKAIEDFTLALRARAHSQWRKLKPAERKARRWADVPRQVAASMAFEGEPVDLEWLKTLHNRRTPRAS